MTTTELCESAGLSRSNVQQWLECGFLEAENVGIPGGGDRRGGAGQTLVFGPLI